MLALVVFLMNSLLVSTPLIFGSTSSDAIVLAANSIQVSIPEFPLAPDSMQLSSTSNSQFTNWEDRESLQAYDLMQRVIQIWQKRGVTDYLIYGKEAENSHFNWEIVPFPKKEWAFFKQFKVLWNITFGAPSVPLNARQQIAKDFQKELAANPFTKQAESIAGMAKDAFCNPKVIESQLVFEGKEICLLYNYAPIGQEKLHFLIVPKKHRSGFADLTANEHLEAHQTAQRLIEFYKGKGYHTAYLFDKTGVQAGQTVPHWHRHIVLTATKSQELFGKLTVFKNMLTGSSPLSKAELAQRVKSLKGELLPIFAN